MHYHAERGNDQGEAGVGNVLEETSATTVGKVIPDLRSFPRYAWECSH